LDNDLVVCVAPEFLGFTHVGTVARIDAKGFSLGRHSLKNVKEEANPVITKHFAHLTPTNLNTDKEFLLPTGTVVLISFAIALCVVGIMWSILTATLVGVVMDLMCITVNMLC